MTWPQIVVVGAGYLVGSISFTRLIARVVVPGAELSTTEMDVEGTNETWVYRGVSATSLLSRVGARWMVLAVVLDAVKAGLPTLLARLAWPDAPVYLAVAVAAVIGHIWPIWHGFQGGRGQSPILGVLLVIDPLSILFVILVGALVGLVVFTSVYHARNGSPFYLPIWFLWTGGWGPELVFAVALAVVYLLAVKQDIAEDGRVRRATGFNDMVWTQRLRRSLNDFFSMNDA